MISEPLHTGIKISTKISRQIPFYDILRHNSKVDFIFYAVKEHVMQSNRPESVDAYIESFPDEAQKAMIEVRATIRAAAPDAEEMIAYQMPAYKYKGKPLVYFGAFKNHIGFYATPTGHEAFKDALSKYKQGKGSVQFPLHEPMPLQLIKDIVKFRLAENATSKKNERTQS